MQSERPVRPLVVVVLDELHQHPVQVPPVHHDDVVEARARSYSDLILPPLQRFMTVAELVTDLAEAQVEHPSPALPPRSTGSTF